MSSREAVVPRGRVSSFRSVVLVEVIHNKLFNQVRRMHYLQDSSPHSPRQQQTGRCPYKFVEECGCEPGLEERPRLYHRAPLLGYRGVQVFSHDDDLQQEDAEARPTLRDSTPRLCSMRPFYLWSHAGRLRSPSLHHGS